MHSTHWLRIIIQGIITALVVPFIMLGAGIALLTLQWQTRYGKLKPVPLPPTHTLFKAVHLDIARTIKKNQASKLRTNLLQLTKAQLNSYDLTEFTLLHYAVYVGLQHSFRDWTLLCVLVQHGADPLKKEHLLSHESVVSLALQHLYRNSYDHSALLLKALLDGGMSANVYCDHESTTPIIFRTVGHVHPAALQLLISHGADVNSRDLYGRTPLMEALSDSSFEAVDILLNHGADPLAIDAMGRSFSWQLAEHLDRNTTLKYQQALINLRYRIVRMGATWPPVNDWDTRQEMRAKGLTTRIPWGLRN